MFEHFTVQSGFEGTGQKGSNGTRSLEPDRRTSDTSGIPFKARTFQGANPDGVVTLYGPYTLRAIQVSIVLVLYKIIRAWPDLAFR